MAIVIGASAGGFAALTELFSVFPADFNLPILVVEHLHHEDNGRFSYHLGEITPIPVIEPCDKEQIKSGCIYVAPANYHMLAESDGTIALSIDPKVGWSRPSIDVLFESAAHLWKNKLIAVILTGANADGAKGMKMVKEFGGTMVAQDPTTAESPSMPQYAINMAGITNVLSLQEIGEFLCECSDVAPRIQKTKPVVEGREQ
ncbi:MAG TPA: chemotaxis protein CheB [bacterium]|nr:chemotaxis protein CheB [bacterium]